MWQHVHTLRFKLTFLYVLVFALIVTPLSVVVLTIWEQNVLADVDDRLSDRCDSAIDRISTLAQEEEAIPITEDVQPELRGLRKSRYYFQLREADGTSIVRTPNLRRVRMPLPGPPEKLRDSSSSHFQTVTGEAVASLLGADGQMRVLTRFCNLRGVKPFFLQVGLNLGVLDPARAQLRRALAVVFPIGALLAGAASWLMARRSLAPIRRIAREARELTAAHLDRRIPHPPARDEVGELVATFNQMLDRLEDAFQAQERFVADAAHELKTPIAVVLGGAQVLEKKPRTPEEHERFVATVQEEMRRLAQLVDSLLTLARADAGLPLASAQTVSVNEVVTDVVQRWQSIAEQRSVRLHLSLAMPGADAPEPFVSGDAELLDAMVSNLINNGIRHCPSGQAVEVGVRERNRRVEVIVRDHGPGIPPEHLSRVFERFYRVPQAGERENGTGLGLAIAKGVARLHKGSIHAANRPDGGCEITVELPIAAPAGP